LDGPVRLINSWRRKLRLAHVRADGPMVCAALMHRKFFYEVCRSPTAMADAARDVHTSHSFCTPRTLMYLVNSQTLESLSASARLPSEPRPSGPNVPHPTARYLFIRERVAHDPQRGVT
jgi:hypothetical protein